MITKICTSDYIRDPSKSCYNYNYFISKTDGTVVLEICNEEGNYYDYYKVTMNNDGNELHNYLGCSYGGFGIFDKLCKDCVIELDSTAT